MLKIEKDLSENKPPQTLNFIRFTDFEEDEEEQIDSKENLVPVKLKSSSTWNEEIFKLFKFTVHLFLQAHVFLCMYST